MTAVSPGIESFSFAGEKAGRAGASALRKIKPLAESTSPNRLFEAIASLSDVSASAAIEYERAAIAALKSEIAEAEIRVAHANELADRLHDHLAQAVPIPLPNFFRRKR